MQAVGADGYNEDLAKEIASDKPEALAAKNRQRKRSTASKRFKRKKLNVIDAARYKVSLPPPPPPPLLSPTLDLAQMRM